MGSTKFGEFGGQYVPESLMRPLQELEEAYNTAKNDPKFWEEYNYYIREYAGGPTPLYFAKNLTVDLGGAKVYLKREDLNHTGAHKINNVIGQILLAKRMGKKKVIAETGAGQHGVATATAAALFNMECTVLMGKEDMERQELNVFRMEMLGAKVIPALSGTQTLKDATNEAIREWVRTVEDTYYVIGSVVGPHPYPVMVRDFQRIIGDEIKKSLQEKEGRLPDMLIACVGGGSNAAGMFYPFIEDESVELIGVEAAGKGIDTPLHAATFAKGRKGIIHGMKTYLIQDDDGNVYPVYSISAGLDYPGVGPEHSFLFETKRAEYASITDDESIKALHYLSRTEGIIPAIESAHAVAHAIKVVPKMDKDKIVVINISGRGDKDMHTVIELAKNGGKSNE